jgi:hypothetical protein
MVHLSLPQKISPPFQGGVAPRSGDGAVSEDLVDN